MCTLMVGIVPPSGKGVWHIHCGEWGGGGGLSPGTRRWWSCALNDGYGLS